MRKVVTQPQRTPEFLPSLAHTEQKGSDFLLGVTDQVRNQISDNSTDQTSDTGATDTNDTVNESTPSENTLFSDANNAPQVGEDFSTFITLLTAQIRNQDPLAPLDSTQFVEQLATFSNLELQAKGNQTLEEISRLLAASVYGPPE